MNIILFSATEVQLPLPRDDARARHIEAVLRRRPGDTFDAGIVDGPFGKGTLVAVEAHALRLGFTWGDSPPPLPPVHVLIGIPRPQTARDLLRDLTTLGVASLIFVPTERGESGYRQSSVWLIEETRRLLLAGAAQAFSTRLPVIVHPTTLADGLAGLPPESSRVALDNYEGSQSLMAAELGGNGPVVLAVGAERGWSAAERGQLRDAGFTLAHLGARVLRTETASVAAVTLVKARRGWL